MRVLVVEDEAALREQLRAGLTAAGHTVDLAADGEEGLYAGLEFPVDTAIIDIGLPKLGGLELIRQLRARGRRFAILVLTARDRWQDKVEGLGAGADDYLAKPFHFEELQARLAALVRRSAGWTTSELRCGPVELDTRSQRLLVNGTVVELTSFEYRLLELLMLHAGEVLSKTELTEKLYAQDFERDSNVIEVLIARLRRKLDPDETFKPIQTLRGRGYRFALERSAGTGS
jgi:two-component system response regulator PhoP